MPACRELWVWDDKRDGMTDFLTLAHLSDIHLPPPRPYLGSFCVKRLLGIASWYAARRRQHLAETVAAIVADIQSQAPDHIAVTGDLVNLGLAWEHAAAARWLATLGPPARVTAIPGNHDIYADMADAQGIGRWRSFATGDEAAASGEAAFPFVRCLGNVALIGLNSAIPTPPFRANGRLGADQLRRLGEILASLGTANLVRVVLIHHPPLPGQTGALRALQDANDLVEVLSRHGAELVLHGHNHCAMLAFTDGPVRPIPVVGVPSASLGRAHGKQTLAGYNLYRIAPDPAAPIEMIERAMAMPGGKVTETRRLVLGADLA